MLKLTNVSPSRFKTFDMCLFKYWMTYQEKQDLKSNWGAVHGSLIHDVLENYVDGSESDWMARLYRGYNGTLDTLDRYGKPEIMDSPLLLAKDKDFKNVKPYCDSCPFADNILKKCTVSDENLDNLSGCPRNLFEASINMMNATIRRYTTDIWPNVLRDDKDKIIGTEYPFKIRVPGTDVDMIGIMDLVVAEDEDTIHVYDYKSGTWTQNYQECKQDLQVKMYSLASRKEFIEDINNKGYNFKHILLTFDYFTKDPITVALTPEDDAATEKEVGDRIRKIQTTEWIDRIVRSDAEFKERSRWKCRSLCDTEVCSKVWEGRFKTDES